MSEGAKDLDLQIAILRAEMNELRGDADHPLPPPIICAIVWNPLSI